MTTSRDGKKVPSRSRKTSDPTVAPMRTSKKPDAAEPAVRAPDAPGEPVSAEERAQKISEQAYLIAEARGFEPGHELEDWLTAERAVDARLAGTPHQ